MANLCTIHGRRVTLQGRDMQLVRVLRDHMGDPIFSPGKYESPRVPRPT